MFVTYKEFLEMLRDFLQIVLNDNVFNTDEKISYARVLDKIEWFLGAANGGK